MGTQGDKHASGADEVRLPGAPIDKVLAPIDRFMHVASASGVVLLVCAVVAMVIANSPWSDGYLAFWKTKVGFKLGDVEVFHSLSHWVNDALMAIFFFVMGLEVKREIVRGELSTVRKAALPVAAAIGGMLVPAVVFLALAGGGPAADGWGIPMATDIAFVVGCLAVLGERVPKSLRVLLVSLAIADDIGAILVIAVGYTETIHTNWLVGGAACIALTVLMARVGVRSIPVYVVVGAALWFCFHESGVHATIAGVILGLLTPARSHVSEGLFGRFLSGASDVFHGGSWGTVQHRPSKVRAFRKAALETISPLEHLESSLHPWVAFGVMPVFALANAAVPFELSDIGEPVALAVGAGLVLGKPLGIVVSAWIAVKLGAAELPLGVSWKALLGGGCLAGIGFAMALFVAGLALQGDQLDVAKVGVLVGSLISAALGIVILVSTLPKPKDV